MKKILVMLFALVFLVNFAVAVQVAVQDVPIQAMMVGDDTPLKVDLDVTNQGPSDTFTIYNLIGFETAAEKFQLSTGESKVVTLTIQPKENMAVITGKYNYQYFIRGEDGKEQAKSFIIDIFKIKDAFELGATDITPEDSTVNLVVKNNMNYKFGTVQAKFYSDFFSFNNEFTIEPYQTKTFTVEVDAAKLAKLVAGYYTIKADLSYIGQAGTTEGTVRFAEKNNLVTTETKSGWVSRNLEISKTNKGNTVIESKTVLSNNLITRLFTAVSPEPTTIERKGLTVTSTWINSIKPSQTFVVTSTTNWLYPIIVLALLLVIVYIYRMYFAGELSIRKNATYVRTNSGDFAIKVTIAVKAHNYIERVNIRERLPGILSVHPRFGGEQPIRVDETSRRIDWRFEKMEAGEVRRISYVLYSRMGVLGRFELPKAKAVYEKDNKVHEVTSNKTFFIPKVKLFQFEEKKNKYGYSNEGQY